MGKCTAAQAVAAMDYWVGYMEKATSAYATSRDKSVFTRNAGSNNWTYAGHISGLNGGTGAAWCAMQDGLAIYEACGNNKALAKEVLWGVWPYTNAGQVYDAAPASMKGRRGSWKPQPGDIIDFQKDGVRVHTAMVYAVDDKYVYTDEGNSSDMCKRRSYLLTDTYIYGYVRPNYAAASGDDPAPIPVDQYGAVVYKDIGLHELSKGCAGPEVKTIQRIIFARGINKSLDVDGAFGPATKSGVMALQRQLGLSQDGIVGKDTWCKVLRELD
nr:peptidoglycan-binding protein [uncultured Dysosmobacter sp.]